VLALNYALQYRWFESRKMADKAIEVAGARPLNVIYTFAYNNLGHKSRTLDIMLRVFDEDPLNPRATQNLIGLYARAGEDEKALQWEQLAVESGFRYQRHNLIPAYARKGDVDTARQIARMWVEEHGFAPDVGELAIEAFMTYGAGGLPLGQAIWNYIAAGASGDKVFALVSEAIPQGKFNQISLIFPEAAPYRQDPRFVEIYTDLGLVDYWKSVELPDFCDSEQIEGLCG
jgi:hypothetical protein